MWLRQRRGCTMVGTIKEKRLRVRLQKELDTRLSSSSSSSWGNSEPLGRSESCRWGLVDRRQQPYCHLLRPCSLLDDLRDRLHMLPAHDDISRARVHFDVFFMGLRET